MRRDTSEFAKAGFPAQQASVMQSFSRDVQANLLAGRPIPGDSQSSRGANLRWFPLQATTPNTPDTEFSIEHGLSTIPYNLIPCLPLDSVGAKLVDLTVTRAADVRRIYLSSSVTDAPITVFIEAPIGG